MAGACGAGACVVADASEGCEAHLPSPTLQSPPTQVEALVSREMGVARDLLAAKQRDRALVALKRKRLQEGRLESIDAYLLNVEQAGRKGGSGCGVAWSQGGGSALRAGRAIRSAGLAFAAHTPPPTPSRSLLGSGQH